MPWPCCLPSVRPPLNNTGAPRSDRKAHTLMFQHCDEIILLCVVPSSDRASAMASTVVNPHDKMRGRDVNKVALGEQAPRPPHEPDSVADSPPPPPDGAFIDLRTAPCDFRFPTTNQTRHCYVRYLEYHRCMEAKEGDKSECDKFQRYYRSLCPTDWVVEWNRQREEGIFPGPI